MTATVLAALYAQVDRPVVAAGLCLDGTIDVPQSVQERLVAQTVPVVACSELERSEPADRVRLKTNARPAVALSVDEVEFLSATSAKVEGHYNYGGFGAQGFIFMLAKRDGTWSVEQQLDLWVS